MERKSSKEYSIVFVVEGEKFKLRELPSSSPSLCYSRRKDCSVLQETFFLGGKEMKNLSLSWLCNYFVLQWLENNNNNFVEERQKQYLITPPMVHKILKDERRLVLGNL